MVFRHFGINFSKPQIPVVFLTLISSSYLFLWHHCKLALSLHLPHLKLRFTKYPYVSLGDRPSLPLMFPAYCGCSDKDWWEH